jgi:hypothetical protein
MYYFKAGMLKGGVIVISAVMNAHWGDDTVMFP